MLNSPAVQIEGLTVIRGRTTVLPDLTVSVPRGSVTGLLGPSGCGKSTLIRAIAGIQVVKAGTVTVLDGPAGRPDARRRVGYVTQASSVYPDLTVMQNLLYFAALIGSDEAAAREAVDNVGLADKADALVADLSGGQRTRVSLAAALLADPELYLLDEPTVGLDPVLRRDLWQLFKRLADQGRTLLVSSHVMDEAGRCDRVLLMREGRIIADSTPDELRADTGQDDLEQAFLTLAEAAA
ncbi:multidrug ABC transporter ATP-binding protein [Aeromicrobium sp. Root344]|uniref:ABC transporter ATP-binding protein n=1 Tax=Aeromicrobium sp. Root344 TaxID=1736521 RepID=UPI0006FC1397|nr:ABC transporter ATP-binding protein [Aeromicrobium sp. Root344]KQV75140.1 multidrug ABC transporter ATP-binding protein [Aeromicrobium sp. Root344]